MKTVSTKIDNNLHNRFIEVCNEDGKCQSEFLRDLIESVCDDLGTSTEVTPPEPKATVDQKLVSEGKITKISNDDGKTWVVNI